LPGCFLPALALASEANLVLPDLATQSFLGIDGKLLLMLGMVVAALGLVFGLVQYWQLKNLPVHKSMLEISELIYETCKTYLLTRASSFWVSRCSSAA
jgi:K(+)-stimulated pyrophosphate-energized sodium pump